jgi:hypothetical protein
MLLSVFASFFVLLQMSPDHEKFVLHPQPLEYNYSEFERLLLGIALHVYVTKKKTEAFEEVGQLVSMHAVFHDLPLHAKSITVWQQMAGGAFCAWYEQGNKTINTDSSLVCCCCFCSSLVRL